jgi:transposase InsO family protein
LGLTLAEVPSRVDGEVKEGLLKLVDDAVAGGWPHARACRTLGVSDVRVHRWRKRQSEIGSLENLAPGGNPVHRLLAWEIDAILELIETWGPTDRTHRKLAHRGSYLGIVYVAPSTVLRVAESADVALPGEPPRARPVPPALPEIPWEPNRIWIWDASAFGRAKRTVWAIIDVVSRYWIGWLSSSEQTATQVQLLFAQAMADQGLLGPDGQPLRRGEDGEPALIAWSDNGPEMTAGDTKTFMALMAILQHHGRPGTPTDQAHIESFFGHLKREWPHLEQIRDPAVLDAELARVRTEWNTVRLHQAIGYVTPDDEHHGRGPRIRRARKIGMRDARRDRIDYNRNHPPENGP